jgi:hypothetical protein
VAGVGIAGEVRQVVVAYQLCRASPEQGTAQRVVVRVITSTELR